MNYEVLRTDAFSRHLKQLSKKYPSIKKVITFLKIELKAITLLDIYDKSEKENITDSELAALLKIAAE